MRTQSSFSGVRESKISSPVHPPEDSCWMVCSMRCLQSCSSCARSTMSPSPQTAFLVDSRVSPSMCCSEWCLAKSQTGSICRNTRKVHNARTSFHRVVRRYQNQFWSDWQENISVARELPSCSLVSPTDVQWSVKT